MQPASPRKKKSQLPYPATLMGVAVAKSGLPQTQGKHLYLALESTKQSSVHMDQSYPIQMLVVLLSSMQDFKYEITCWGPWLARLARLPTEYRSVASALPILECPTVFSFHHVFMFFLRACCKYLCSRCVQLRTAHHNA